MESLILLLLYGLQFFQFLVVVLQGLDLKIQFFYLLFVNNPLCFNLNLHFLLILICDRLVLFNQCSSPFSHIISVYYLEFLSLCSFSGPLYSQSIIFNLWFNVLWTVVRIQCMWWRDSRFFLKNKSIILYSLLNGVCRILTQPVDINHACSCNKHKK